MLCCAVHDVMCPTEPITCSESCLHSIAVDCILSGQLCSVTSTNFLVAMHLFGCRFVMWYEGVAADGSRSIGIAVSNDGVSDWIRHDRSSSCLLSHYGYVVPECLTMCLLGFHAVPCSALFCPALFCLTLFCHTLFCHFVLHLLAVFCFACPALPCSALPCSALLQSSS